MGSIAQLQRSPQRLEGVSNRRLRPRLAVWTQPPQIIMLVRIVEFLSRRVVIECVSSLAYPNLISCSPARTSRSSLSALTAPAMSGLCSLIWIPHFTVLIIQFLAVTPAHFDLLQTLQTTWSRSSTCWPRPHLDNSVPLAPTDQFGFRQFAAGFWLETLFLFQCRALSLGTTAG